MYMYFKEISSLIRKLMYLRNNKKTMITSIQLRQTNQFSYQLKVLFKYQKI